jgi:hypothetical protein
MTSGSGRRFPRRSPTTIWGGDVFDVVTQRLALLGQTRARVMRPAEAEPAGRSTVSVVVPRSN